MKYGILRNYQFATIRWSSWKEMRNNGWNRGAFKYFMIFFQKSLLTWNKNPFEKWQKMKQQRKKKRSNESECLAIFKQKLKIKRK